MRPTYSPFFKTLTVFRARASPESATHSISPQVETVELWVPGSSHRGAPRRRKASDSTEQNQNQNDDQNEPDAAGRVNAPAAAIGPRRQGAEEDENQNNDQDRSE